jgi:NhaA family Na+:H+ antiporter
MGAVQTPEPGKLIDRAAAAFAAFFRMEPAAGVLLFVAAVLAMIVANSPFAVSYQHLLSTQIGFRAGVLDLRKPLLLWVNDGLMAVFFFSIAMEMKLEMAVGALADLRKAMLPAIAAVGGMLAPALIFVALNWQHPQDLRGWAIPTATDIAFSLGILALVAPPVPHGLKIFLMSLAIFDDLGAILIIAMFYASAIDPSLLLLALLAIGALFALNRLRVQSLPAYFAVGLLLWLAVLKSGVHATLAGVALGLFIPLGDPSLPIDNSPLRRTLARVHPWVAYAILPVFAFMNSGVPLGGLSLESLTQPIPLGIALGLFLGKQVGVMGFTWLSLRLGATTMPAGVRLKDLYGVALLCGVGFTMSLFIASLAFMGQQEELGRLGIMLGSVLSGIVGYAVLTLSRRTA